MAICKTDLEIRLYNALRRIARDYETAERLLRHGEVGLSGEETLQYAYENIQSEAKHAIKGVRVARPAQPKERCGGC